ncbi:Aste57867_2399 [Aphanomyces stellatus]|uniref:Aste57867_2399 protein n=1 Tax=Aphanomyces stellatus TaxID=120398 RepID=A0A485KD52_9STRA|nr:hypothetical protein As57867_002393 [Aphanomyces stellatus]VFT79600.1 Aste57867_2399 [Aphanomyces stellatus]
MTEVMQTLPSPAATSPPSSSSSPSLGFMSPFELTREDEADLHDLARGKVASLLAATAPDPPCPTVWTRTKSHAVYERTTPTEMSVRASVVVRGASASTLLTLLDGGGSATTYRPTLRRMYQHTFADTAVLFRNPRLSATESLGVQWTAFRCQNPLLPDVDLCCVEYVSLAGGAAHPLGNQEDAPCDARHCLGFKLCTSFQTKHCPSLLESHRLERLATPLAGFVLFPTDAVDVIRVVFTMSLAVAEDPLRHHANRRLLRFLAAALPRLQLVVDATHAAIAAPPPLAVDADPTALACHLCARLFSHARRRRPCHGCGHTVCHVCCHAHDVTLPSVGLTRVRLCTSCHVKVTPATPPMTTPPRPRQTTVTAPPPPPPRPQTTLPPATFAPVKLNLDLDLVHTPSSSSSTKAPSPSSAWTTASPLTKHPRFPHKGGATFAVRHPPTSPLLSTSSPSKRPSLPQIDSPARKPSTQHHAPPPPHLLAACDRACAALGAKFAAVAIAKSSQDPIAVLAHYLHAHGSGKLLPVPPQMALCAPVLAGHRPVAVANTLATTPSSTTIDWAKLPIVMGPQKARFYMGVPLVGPYGQKWGALAVFDPTARDPTALSQTQLQALEEIADSIVAALQRRWESRRRSDDDDDDDDMREEVDQSAAAASPARKASFSRGGHGTPHTNQDGVLA